VAVLGLVVTDPHDDEQPGEQSTATSALMGEQLRAARAEVFRAYREARERARDLVEDERRDRDRDRQGPRGS
jgi:hypothetical protein